MVFRLDRLVGGSLWTKAKNVKMSVRTQLEPGAKLYKALLLRFIAIAEDENMNFIS